MTVQCPSCQGVLRISQEHLGKKVRCPRCQTVIAITAPGPAAQARAPVPPPAAAPGNGPEPADGRVPLAEARSAIDRHQGRCRGTWLLDKIPAKELAKARSSFAAVMAADETPLVLGKHYKLLVTDRCLYGNKIERPIPLRSIVTATHSRFELLKVMASGGGPKTQLFINGREIMEAAMGNLPLGFLEPVLEELGEAARRKSPAQPGEYPPEEVARIAAAAVCAGRPAAATASRLAGIGTSHADATRMLDWMTDIFRTPNRLPGILMAAGGLLLIGVCFGVATLMKALGSPVVLVLKGMGTIGVFAVLAGLYHLVSGRSGLDEQGLADAWLQQEGSRV